MKVRQNEESLRSNEHFRTDFMWCQRSSALARLDGLTKNVKDGFRYHYSTLPLSDVHDLPSMTNWVPVQNNIPFDEETILHHIPYLGEDTKGNNEFMRDLTKDYNGMVYGHYLSCDQKLEELVQRLIDPPLPTNTGKLAKSGTSSATSSSSFVDVSTDRITIDNVFRLLADTHSEMGVKADDLSQRYHAYQAKKAAPPAEPITPTMKNIDGCDDLDRAYSSKEAMDSYQRLFCRRCYQYDCVLHKDYSCPPRYRPVQDDDLEYHSACGPSCFLTIQGVNIADYIKRVPSCSSSSLSLSSVTSNFSYEADVTNVGEDTHNNNRADDDDGEDELSFENQPRHQHQTQQDDLSPQTQQQPQPDVDPIASIHQITCRADVSHDHWTNAERTLFNVLMTTMEDNYCKVAATMGTKSCAEVYVYAMENPSELKQMTCTTYADSQHHHSAQVLKRQKQEQERAAKCKKKQGRNTLSGSRDQKDKPRIPYQPCDHSPELSCGAKESANHCSCAKNNSFCEKFCNCSADCLRKFTGCNCKASCITKACPCFSADRECDPDLCKTCGSRKCLFR